MQNELVAHETADRPNSLGSMNCVAPQPDPAWYTVAFPIWSTAAQRDREPHEMPTMALDAG
jgi:hypothetical protein